MNPGDRGYHPGQMNVFPYGGSRDDTPNGGVSCFHHEQRQADAHTASRARSELADWLRGKLAPSRVAADDVLLAVYEALANAAEHAYVGARGSRTVQLEAQYDADEDSLSVTVEDHGRWQAFDQLAPLDPHSIRGRGIRMMRVLADEANIAFSPHGTRVELSWHPPGS